MTSAYYSTHDLCARFRCSSRTLFRRMQRKRNPFPAACIRNVGSCNLWDVEDVAAWEAAERALTREIHLPESEAVTMAGVSP